MLSRRTLVGRAAAGLAVAMTAGAAGVRPASAKPPAERTGLAERLPNAPVTASETAAPAPWSLLAPLQAGATLAHGWRLTSLRGVTDDGSLVVGIESAKGRRHRVHLCRNDGRPHGLAHTKQFDLLIMNGGEGDRPTDEALAQAIARLAAVIAANEDSWRDEGTRMALLSHDQRLVRFQGEDGARLR